MRKGNLKGKLRKIFVGITATGTAIALLPLFAAFEAHVINVTAQIENALAVSADTIDFGTVFPQEHLERPLNVRLSQSFLDEGRVDDVNYFIRQKPKCGITTSGGEVLVAGSTVSGEVFVGTAPASTTPDHTFFQGEGYYVDCGLTPPELAEGQAFGMLPLLCPYISKESVDQNDGDTPSFHQPWTIASSTIVWTDTLGRLAKSEQDISDDWIIDLAVPCFGGNCAQDWADFVRRINPDANADDFVADIADEHKVFGCDLWVEVTEVSETPDGPETGVLTVTKLVINDDVGTTATTSFTYTIDSGSAIPFEADGSNSQTLPDGAHVVAEPAVSGYTTTFGGACDAGGNVTVVANATTTCSITNNDNELENGTLTITKVVTNDSEGGPDLTAADFSFAVDGGASTPFEADGTNVISVAPGTYDVLEDAEPGYVTTYSNSANASANCDDLVVPAAGNVTCTITNNDDITTGTITVTKILTNDDGGNNIVTDFVLTLNGNPVTSGTPNTGLAPGAYDVSETGPSGYSAVFSGDCDADGDITIAAGESKTCTITNNDIAPNITLIKSVVNNGPGTPGTATPASFTMRVNGTHVPSGTSIVVSANFLNVIDEDALAGYTFTGITGSPECPAVLGGTATLDEGEAITCTIANDDIGTI